MEKTIIIQNLKCSGCENTVITNLVAIDGVESVHLNVIESRLSLKYRNENVFQEVGKKLSKLGYPIVGDENSFVKKATSYVSCAIGKLNT